MELEIRKAVIDDVEGIVTNRLDFLFELTGKNQTGEFIRSTRDYIRKHICDDSLLTYLAISNGQIVSSVIVCIYDVIPKLSNPSGKIGYVFNVFTIKEYRGQGLASTLMNNVTEAAKQLGIGELYLSATEEGKGLYEKLQYKLLNNEMCLKLV